MSRTERAATIQIPLDLGPDALVAAVGSLPGAAILESGPGFASPDARWSLWAAEPLARFSGDDHGWHVWTNPDRPAELPAELLAPVPGPRIPILDHLDRTLHTLGLGQTDDPPPAPNQPPLTGGLIGFFSYDLAPWIERLPRRAPAEGPVPPLSFALYDQVMTHDHLTGQTSLHLTDFGRSLSPTALAQRANRAAATWLNRASSAPAAAPLARELGSAFDQSVVSRVTRPAYEAAIERALDYIRSGDIFQVNLSQRFEAPWPHDPLALYQRTRQASPSPFAAFLRWPDFAVVSASPESFYQTRGDAIVTRPIKGTRPRGDSPDHDAQLLRELRASAKDRAELTMIVDLERNDLGRVCRYGSVRVTEAHAIEAFAQVHHQVATVEGRLRPDTSPAAIVRAMFPGGSITGAPKIRAMQIIDELEPCRRGLYTGAIGYYGAGASGFNIAIRTAVAANGRLAFHAGGGIVADSQPSLEYDETLHKARGLRLAIDLQGLPPS